LIYAFFVGVFVGALFVSVFDWAVNLRNETWDDR